MELLDRVHLLDFDAAHYLQWDLQHRMAAVQGLQNLYLKERLAVKSLA